MPYVMARTPDREHAANTELDGLTPERRVSRYREIVSPLAYQLAVYFSAVPLTLPVMRVVQRVMLPTSDSSPLRAEFFLGGLVERITKQASNCSAEEVEYDFVTGVREILQTSILRSQAFEVLAAVSKYIEQHLGESFDFRALVPDAQGNYQLAASAKPFATIGANLLRRIGRPARGRLSSLRTVQPMLEEEFVAGITIREKLSLARDAQKMSWSPDGQKLALLVDGEIRTLWVGSGEIAAEFSIGGVFTALSWLGNATLACAAIGPSISLLGERSRWFTRFSADESTITLGWYDGEGEAFYSRYGEITEMAYSDAGLAVAFSHNAMAYFRAIVDWNSTVPLPRVPGDLVPYGGSLPGSVSWSPNLSLAAIISRRRNAANLWSTDQSNLRTCFRHRRSDRGECTYLVARRSRVGRIYAKFVDGVFRSAEQRESHCYSNNCALPEVKHIVVLP